MKEGGRLVVEDEGEVRHVVEESMMKKDAVTL